MGLFDDTKKEAMKEAAEEIEMNKMDTEFPEDTVQEEGGFALPQMPDLSFLKAKTGDGSVEDYMNHPLNLKQSRGSAQMIRGFTGLFGALDLAVVDITLGAFELAKEKRNVAEAGQ